MSERTRTAGLAALVLALVAYAYAPLLAAGFLGGDHHTLTALSVVDAQGGPGLYRVEGTHARPLAALSLECSRLVWTGGGRWTGAEALALWLENLALLAIAALGVHGLVRRVLLPWTTEDPARAAGHAAAALVLLHPLALPAVGRVASRGDLLGLALAAWSARVFVAGRQQRRHRRLVGAWFLALLAGLATPYAALLAPVLAGLEYLSSRRHRPRLARLRTAFTTLVVYGAAAHLEWGGRLLWAPAGEHALLPRPDSWGSPALFLEKLGVLFLPVNVYGLGTAGYLFAGFVVLVALHPGFVAARSAPRLWGRIVLGWGVVLVAVLLPNAPRRVPPGGLDGAYLLLPAAVVMAVGFGVTSTALSGWRRTVVPAAVAALFAILGRAQAVPRELAGITVAELQRDLAMAASERGWGGTLIVLDPPREVAGLDALGGGLADLVAAPFRPSGAVDAGLAVRGVSEAAFRMWSRQVEFEALRQGGACVVLDGGRLDRERAGLRVAIDLPRVEDAGAERLTWRDFGRTPTGEALDPLRARAFRVTARPDVVTDVTPIIRWTAAGAVQGEEEVGGVWVAGTSLAPVAVFDMGTHLAWLLGGRIRSTWFPGALDLIVTAQVAEAPAPLGGGEGREGGPPGVVPRALADDWHFDVSLAAPPEPLSGAGYWRLALLALGTLEQTELAPALEVGGRLRFDGAARWVEAAVRAGAGPVVWDLDRRVDGVTVARASNRRTAPAPTAGGTGE